MDRLCILDLDGTLLDTAEDLARAANHALARAGYPPHTLDEYHHLVGHGIGNLLLQALPEDARSREAAASMRADFLAHYDAHKADNTRPYPGIAGFLRLCTDNGVRLAVASNKYQAGTDGLVARFFPDVPWACVLGQREGLPLKPDPAVIQLALSAAPGLGLGDVLYVGDSDVDMQTGLAAGVRTAGALWGFRGREELQAYHPWRLVADARELSEAVLADWSDSPAWPVDGRP